MKHVKSEHEHDVAAGTAVSDYATDGFDKVIDNILVEEGALDAMQKDLKQQSKSNRDALLKRIKFLEARHKEDALRLKEAKKTKKKLMDKMLYLQKKNAKLLMVIADMRKKEILSREAALVLSAASPRVT